MKIRMREVGRDSSSLEVGGAGGVFVGGSRRKKARYKGAQALAALRLFDTSSTLYFALIHLN